jgi:hypothetical protein
MSVVTPRATVALALLVCSAVVACRDPLRPEDVVGVYALQWVESDVLPTVLYTNDNVRVRVLADTLRFRADGTGERAGLVESESLRPGVASAGQRRAQQEFRFRTGRGRIEIAFVCPINANCAAPPHIVAKPVRGGLLVEYDLGARVPQVFTTVAEATAVTRRP